METPWSRAKKLRSTLQEEKLGKLPGGRQHPGSGRFWRFHRDGRLHDFLIEARTNEKPTVDTYRISRKEFLRIKQEALQTPPGLLPGMQIQIQDLNLIVIELQVFQDMIVRLITYEGEASEE